jgi:pilus assembly protein Flp/PilA
MVKFIRSLSRFAAARRAVTALEYGLIAAVIGGVVIIAATGFGNSLTNAYTSIGGTVQSEAAGM